MDNSTHDWTLCILARHVENVTEDGLVTSAIGGCGRIAFALSRAIRTTGVYMYGFSVNDSERCRMIIYNSIADNPDYADRISFPYEVREVSFAARAPGYVSNEWAFVNCFTEGVWAALAGTALLVAVAVTLAFQAQFHFVLFDTLVSLLGQMRDWQPKRPSQTTIILTWRLAGLFLILGFSSVLLSAFTAPKRSRGLETVDDVYRGIQDGSAKALEVEGLGIGNILIFVTDEKVRTIGEDILSHAEVVPGVTRLEQRAAVFSLRLVLKMHYYDDQYKLADAVVKQNWYALIHRGAEIDKVFREKVDHAIHWVWASGIMMRYFNLDILKNRKAFTHLGEDSPVKPLSLWDLSGVFIVLIAGHGVSTVVLVVEIVVNRITRRNR